MLYIVVCIMVLVASSLPSSQVSDTGQTDTFCDDLLQGLSERQKRIPSKYLYDPAGSDLFEEICTLDEYYIPRVETALLAAHAPEIADLTGDAPAIVEFGSGGGHKVRILLEALSGSALYVPIDISPSALDQSVSTLEQDFPDLQLEPVYADFTAPVALPELNGNRRIGFFPGSTIGNFTRPEAAEFLAGMGKTLGAGSDLLIGVDLKKDLAVLHPAYDDARGVTAAFNLNLLARANREADADFDQDAFQHQIKYNDAEGRIEMHLVSAREQVVTVSGEAFPFGEGESIHTENSYKYTVEEFAEVAMSAGWEPLRLWQDGDAYFSLHYLRYSQN